MRLGTVLAVAAVIALLFGLAFLLLPEQSLSIYGLETDAVGYWSLRYFGVALVGLALACWMLRSYHSVEGERTIALTFIVGQVIGLLVSLWNVLSPEGTPMHWLNVAIYGVLALMFAWVLVGTRAALPAAPASR